MNRRFIIGFLLSAVWLFLIQACGDEKFIGPVEPNDVAPGQVTNVEVENVAGGAKITYTLPSDDQLLYVLVEYQIREGVLRTARASYHQNFVTVDGFPDTDEYEVKLYSVSRGDHRSDPLTLKVNPLTPQVQTTFQDLEVRETFGGVSITYDNASGADLAISVSAEDSLGQMKLAQTYYTKSEGGTFAVRGFDAQQRKFSVHVEDRWENSSDTVSVTLTPLFEKELDKTLFSELHLETDNWQANATNNQMVKIWDNSIATNQNRYNNRVGQGFPQSFSFSMGVEATLSRLVIHPRNDGQNYYLNQPRIFEIWGSNDPDPHGSWDNWTKLTTCEIIKPSGLPTGEFNAEDRAFYEAGIEFEFPPGIPAVQYIRFRTMEIWTGSNVEIWEVTLFGNDDKK